jgi:hypothetical protein
VNNTAAQDAGIIAALSANFPIFAVVISKFIK